jgi:hypothetical protein
MSRKSIKRTLRDAIAAHLQTQAGSELTGVDVFSTFAGSELTTRHIRITTPAAEPQTAGETNLGRWAVTVNIAAVTQTDDFTEDQHDDLAGLVEAYAVQGNKTLATAWTGSGLTVDNVYVRNGGEMQNGTLRYSMQELEVECYIPA